MAIAFYGSFVRRVHEVLDKVQETTEAIDGKTVAKSVQVLRTFVHVAQVRPLSATEDVLLLSWLRMKNVLFLTQKEKRPAGIGRQSAELWQRLQGVRGLRVRKREVSRGFEANVLGRRRFGWLSLMANNVIPFRRSDGEIVHAADWGLMPFFGDTVDLLQFYDPYPWQHLDVHQSRVEDALRISLHVPRILQAKNIVVPTQYIQGHVQRLFNRPSVVIPCGIDAKKWKTSNVERLKRTALIVGADHPRKCMTKVIEACGRIGYRLQTIGWWNWPGSRENAFKTAKRNSVSMHDLGYVDDWQLARYYAKASVVVSASLDEGFGLTPLEALACGAPIAVSDIQPHREVLGKMADHFKPDDVDDIACAMQRAAELRTPTADERVQHAKTYDWSNVVPKWLSLYRTVAA